MLDESTKVGLIRFATFKVRFGQNQIPRVCIFQGVRDATFALWTYQVVKHFKEKRPEAAVKLAF